MSAKVWRVEVHFPLSAIKEQRYKFNLRAKIKNKKDAGGVLQKESFLFFYFLFSSAYILCLLMEKQRSIFHAEGEHGTLKYSICQLLVDPPSLRLSSFHPLRRERAFLPLKRNEFFDSFLYLPTRNFAVSRSLFTIKLRI